MTNTYDLRDTVRLAATFTASGGAPLDPASVWAYTTNPLGSTATYGLGSVASTAVGFGAASIIRTGAGAYYLDIVPSAAGPWNYRFEGGPGSGQAAAATKFVVSLTPFV